MSHYSVYLVESMGMPRNHHAIFIKTGDKKEGTILNVTRNAMNGFTLEIRETSQSPRSEATFESWTEIGVIVVDDLPRVKAICEANPPPGKKYDGLKKIDLRSLCDDARNGPGKRLDICESKVFFCTTTRSCGGSKYRKLNLGLMLGTLSKWSKETLEESHPGATIENDHTVESSGGLDIGRIQHA